jgi:D-alanyl-D-alanine dipeptidase
VKLDPTIKLDIRYAGSNNFVGKPLYKEARAFLQRPAAEALAAAHRELAAHGYGLLIHDGYRPWSVTKLFWEVTPPALREFVADPTTGSKHNRGAAVDLTMYDRALGTAVVMPSEYDEFSKRAYPDYRGGPPDARGRRDLLRAVMERHGFTVEPNEWWHFNYKDWREYPILDMAFGDIRERNF